MLSVKSLCLILLGFLVFESSCKKNEDYNPLCEFSGKLCSCDQTTQSTMVCTDYSKRYYKSATSDCSGKTGGSFKADALCPTTGVVGTCVTTVGAQQDFKRYYNEASQGATDCGLIGGVWQ